MIVHLTIVFVVDLQLCARVMKTPANNKEIIFLFLFTYCFFINFSYYTYRSQKYFLLSFSIICDLTRRDRFIIHAKCLMLSLRESCKYRRLACPYCRLWAKKKDLLIFDIIHWSICWDFLISECLLKSLEIRYPRDSTLSCNADTIFYTHDV